MNQHPTQERLHALDAVRGFALLLGIVLHGTMSFQPGMAAFGWPIIDQSQSYTLQLAFYVIHVFRMATFFLIAGFFARLVFHRRGASTFLKDRSKRIVLPMVGMYLPIAAAATGAVVWAIYKTHGTVGPENMPAPPPGMEPQGVPFPLMHFWFLYILVWIYALVFPLRWTVVRLDPEAKMRAWIDRHYGNLLNSVVAAPVLAVPVALALYLKSDWFWWAGVPTPDQSLIPIWASLFIYAYVFVLGWILERQRHLLQSIRRNSVLNLLMGSVAVVVCLSIAGWQGDIRTADPDWHLAYAFVYGLALISLSLAFIGGGLILFSRENPVIRYLADGSYWIYILHLPIVFALQTWLMDVNLHWSVKFPLILVLSCIPLVLSYHWLVRSTWIGNMLNGRRYARVWPSLQGASPKAEA